MDDFGTIEEGEDFEELSKLAYPRIWALIDAARSYADNGQIAEALKTYDNAKKALGKAHSNSVTRRYVLFLEGYLMAEVEKLIQLNQAAAAAPGEDFIGQSITAFSRSWKMIEKAAKKAEAGLLSSALALYHKAKNELDHADSPDTYDHYRAYTEGYLISCIDETEAAITAREFVFEDFFSVDYYAPITFSNENGRKVTVITRKLLPDGDSWEARRVLLLRTYYFNDIPELIRYLNSEGIIK